VDHFASIDFEDWYHDVEKVAPVDTALFSRAFDRQLERVVDIFDRTHTKATFFVLARTAERHPHWVKRLHDAGHEIATHGWGHERVTSLSPAAFRADLRRSVDVLRGITGQAPRGYRAPFFSVGPRELTWLYDVLSEEGIAYSSSVLPLRLRGRGVDGHPLGITRVTTKAGASLLEIPLAALELSRRRIPFAGGGSWRALPLAFIERGIRALEKEQRAMVMYLHPHEFDTAPLRSHRGLARNVYVNAGRASVAHKLESLLRMFTFRPVGTAT
jgi:polysaccharide deacetylase family protein (PEP-CTERM system associated)